MTDLIKFRDVVSKNKEFGYYEVQRTHSDGVVSTFRCGTKETKKPEEYLDRLLSQHLSGTGKQRERVDELPAKRTRAKKKVAKKKVAAKKKTARRRK